jgi:electron transfer flavoprotein alpha subunit
LLIFKRILVKLNWAVKLKIYQDLPTFGVTGPFLTWDRRSEGVDRRMSKGIAVLVLAEFTEEKLPTQLTLELLGLGRGLAREAGGQLDAVLVGSNSSKAAEEIAHWGPSRVFVADATALEIYNPESYLSVLEDLCDQLKPTIILAGHTPMGQDLAPRLAFASGVGLTTDGVELLLDGNAELQVVKPIYGGNALARYVPKGRPQIATVRARVGEVSERSPSPTGEIVAMQVRLPPARMEIVKRVKEEQEGIKLEEAKVVVAGGRGMGGPEGFDQLQEIADIFGGAVGASRPPCDSEWISSTAQVGITGKIVAPDVYLAVAVSGSSQHLSGMADSRNIIAINKDPDAYIFRVAHYGVVGDWRQVLPAFAGKLRELQGD